jgi:hypothetical protein
LGQPGNLGFLQEPRQPLPNSVNVFMDAPLGFQSSDVVVNVLGNWDTLSVKRIGFPGIEDARLDPCLPALQVPLIERATDLSGPAQWERWRPVSSRSRTYQILPFLSKRGGRSLLDSPLAFSWV